MSTLAVAWQGADERLHTLTPDSVQTLNAARRAQSAFELFRRRRLPQGDAPGGGADCDMRIGRYCYWRDTEDDDDAPPEPPAIQARRLALITLLDSSAAVLPGDRWIAGQRIRYLSEAGRTDDAIAAAQECRADRWWCAALEGYAAHVGQRFTLADSLFDIALDAMPHEQRCRWVDIRQVVERDLSRYLEPMRCEAREAAARAIFWLGAPLWSISATDLRTEHFARLTHALIVQRAAVPDAVSTSNDLVTLELRYGWSRWFTQSPQFLGSPFDADITGHGAGTAYYFLPTLDALHNAASSTDVLWHLDNDRAVSGYAPAFARSVHEIPAQVALFQRGDSTLVVGAWDAQRDSTLIGRDLDAALVLANSNGALVMGNATQQRATGHLQVVAPFTPEWVSLELLAREDRRAGRLRVAIAEPSAGRLALSDLLLYRPTTASSISDFSIARDSAFGTTALRTTRHVGVYWETYGAARTGEPATFMLTVVRVDVPWMRRAAERLRVADPTTATQIEWEEALRPIDGRAARGIRVDLSSLRPGKYHLELRVATKDGSSATTSRDIELSRR